MAKTKKTLSAAEAVSDHTPPMLLFACKDDMFVMHSMVSESVLIPPVSSQSKAAAAALEAKRRREEGSNDDSPQKKQALLSSTSGRSQNLKLAGAGAGMAARASAQIKNLQTKMRRVLKSKVSEGCAGKKVDHQPESRDHQASLPNEGQRGQFQGAG
eukprot:455-Rhodomonas_salina.4